MNMNMNICANIYASLNHRDRVPDGNQNDFHFPHTFRFTFTFDVVDTRANNTHMRLAARCTHGHSLSLAEPSRRAWPCRSCMKKMRAFIDCTEYHILNSIQALLLLHTNHYTNNDE